MLIYCGGVEGPGLGGVGYGNASIGVGYRTAPAITGTIIFLLMALFPCIFCITLKSKVCDGYCLWLSVFILTTFLSVITLLTVFLIIALFYRNQLPKKSYQKISHMSLNPVLLDEGQNIIFLQKSEHSII